MKFIIVSMPFILAGCSWFRSNPQRPEEYWAQFRCPAYKEFVTAYNYLQDQRALQLKTDEAELIAKNVSQGCDGAAKRFIATTDLMLKAQLAGWDAVKLGQEMAVTSDEVAEAFNSIFKTAYLKSYLDLDLRSSLAMARSLSVEFEGNLSQAKKDFKELVSFCVSKENLSLPRPQCGILAAKLAKTSERSEKLSSAESYIELFRFLTDEPQGPRLPAFSARQLAQEVILFSPHAAENFIEGYRFAATRNQKTRKQQVEFAKTIARNTVKLNPKISNYEKSPIPKKKK